MVPQSRLSLLKAFTCTRANLHTSVLMLLQSLGVEESRTVPSTREDHSVPPRVRVSTGEGKNDPSVFQGNDQLHRFTEASL